MRFLADAFHQAAVAGQNVGVVVDQIVSEGRIHDAFAEREADRIAETLAEWAGRRLDAGGMAVFGMTRRLRTDLAEILDLVDRHVLVAGEVEQRIKQHRAMASRQDEAVAVGPVRLPGIEFQEAREQHGGDVGGAHRQARMAGIGLLHGIHGKEADRIGHPVVLVACGHNFSLIGTGFGAATPWKSWGTHSSCARSVNRSGAHSGGRSVRRTGIATPRPSDCGGKPETCH